MFKVCGICDNITLYDQISVKCGNIKGIEVQKKSPPLVVWEIFPGKVGFEWRSGGGAVTGKNIKRVEWLILLEEKREGEQYSSKETYSRERNRTVYLKPRVCALLWLITETVAKLSSYKHSPWELIRFYCLLISTDAFHLAFAMTEGHFFPQRSEANKIKWGMICVWYFKIKQCHCPKQITSI